MRIKTNELTGAALGWAVAKAEGILKHITFDHDLTYPLIVSKVEIYGPHFIWHQGGEIIEREGIGMFCNRTATVGKRFKPPAGADWRAFPYNKHREHHYGPTPLIAAMRCYVASKLGDEVDVPEELA